MRGRTPLSQPSSFSISVVHPMATRIIPPPTCTTGSEIQKESQDVSTEKIRAHQQHETVGGNSPRQGSSRLRTVIAGKSQKKRTTTNRVNNREDRAEN